MYVSNYLTGAYESFPLPLLMNFREVSRAEKAEKKDTQDGVFASHGAWEEQTSRQPRSTLDDGRSTGVSFADAKVAEKPQRSLGKSGALLGRTCRLCLHRKPG